MKGISNEISVGLGPALRGSGQPRKRAPLFEDREGCDDLRFHPGQLAHMVRLVVHEPARLRGPP